MKTKILLLLSLLLLNNTVFSQIELFDSLKNHSEIIAHIKITKIDQSGDWDVGATGVTIQGEIIDLYKGKVKDENQIEFIVVTHTPEFDRMFLNNHYIVFLQPASWVIRTGPDQKITLALTDNWIGIQSFYQNLHNKLKLNY